MHFNKLIILRFLINSIITQTIRLHYLLIAFKYRLIILKMIKNCHNQGLNFLFKVRVTQLHN